MAGSSAPGLLDDLIAKLRAPDATLESKLEAITQVRELFKALYCANTSDVATPMAKVFPVLQELMKTVPPSTPNSAAHMIRFYVLDILNRVVGTESGRAIQPAPVLQLLLEALQVENEENGNLCQRVCFDVHRPARTNLEELSLPYCDFAAQVYANVTAPGGSWERCFGPNAANPPGDSQVFIKATHSFKILYETPNQLVWLYNAYPGHVAQKLQSMVPVILEFAKLAEPHPTAVLQHQKANFHDFKLAQVKAVNLLIYALRGTANMLTSTPTAAQDIADAIAMLFRTCSDNITLRRELLTITRQCVGGPLRPHFYKHLPSFLEEEVLLGRTRACQRELAQQGYSMLAELVHHCRHELKRHELMPIVQVFCRNVQDMLLPSSIQATSVRLLVNLLEVLHARRQPDAAELSRLIVQRMLYTFVDRLERLKQCLPHFLRIEKTRERKHVSQVREEVTGLSAPPTRNYYNRKPEPGKVPESESKEGNVKKRVRTIYHTMEKSEKEKELHDALLMLQTIIAMGLKPCVASLVMLAGARPNPDGPAPPVKLRDEEVRLLGRALEAGVPCLQLADRFRAEIVVRSDGGTRDLYESLAEVFGVFTESSQSCIVEIFGTRMGFLFDSILVDPKVERFVTNLLLNANVNRTFAELLLRELMHVQFHKIAFPDTVEGKLTLKLLTLFFDALSKLPIMESVLQPLFLELVQSTLKQLQESKEKLGYLEVLLSLFRTLNAPAPMAAPMQALPAKFEGLYALFGGGHPGPPTPNLVSPVLFTLKSLLEGPSGQIHKNALLELILIMPARLQDMLTVLPAMMRPVVEALKAGDELVSQALRTLEHWVDSLNPEFLEPAMAAVAPELMLALWSHIKPSPATFGVKVVTLLGKLGGRNRRFLKDPQELEYKPNPEHGMRLILTFQAGTVFLIPLDRLLQLTRKMMLPRPRLDTFQRSNALRIMQICCASYSNLRSPDDSHLPGTAVDKLTAMLFGSEAPPSIDLQSINQDQMAIKTKMQLVAERHVLRQTLASSLLAVGEEDLRSEAVPFAHGVCRHYAMLFAAGVESPPPACHSTSNCTERANVKMSSLKELDAHLFLDAIIMVLTDEIGERARSAGVEAITVFTETLLLLTNEQMKLCKPAASPADPGGPAATAKAEGSAPSASPVPPSEEKMGPPPSHPAGRDGHKTLKPKLRVKMASDGTMPAVLDDLLQRVLHCCFQDTWSARLGALYGMMVFITMLPREALINRTYLFVRGFMNLQRQLPTHAHAEQELVTNALELLFEKAIFNGQPPPYTIPEEEPGPPEQDDMAQDTPETPNVGVLGASPGPVSTATPHAGSPQVAEVKVIAEPPPGTPLPEAVTPEGTGKPAQGTETTALGGPSAEAPPSAGAKSDISFGPSPGSAQGPSPVDRGVQRSMDPYEKMLNTLSQVACVELMSSRSGPGLRAMCERIVRAVRQATGHTVAQVLGPYLEKSVPQGDKRRLLPLRNPDLHCGVLAVLTFCLRQRPTLLPLDAELLNMAGDCYSTLELLETVPAKDYPPGLRGSTSEQLNSLKVACIAFLSALVQWDAFRDSTDLDHTDRRSKFLKVFFMNLAVTDQDIIKYSEEALQSVANHQKMPKQLLQTSLRPILVNLAYYNKLKLPLLHGLARLLSLLATWFNVALGEKLIDHMKKWLEPEKLAPNLVAWEPGEHPKIAAAILDLFHLLPPQGSKFLETLEQPMRPGLVALTIQLENTLAGMPNNICPTIMWSPYRQPLARFLNKYAPEAVSYFLEKSRLSGREYTDRFLDIIQNPVGEPLLRQVAASQDRILALLEGAAPKEGGMLSDLEANALQLVATLASIVPDWMEKPLFTHLLQRWRDPARSARLAREEELDGEHLMESARLAAAMLTYLQRHHQEVDALIDLMDIFPRRSRVGFGFLKDFLDQVPKTYSLPERKQVLLRFLQLFEEGNRSQDHLSFIIKMLIYPLVDAAGDPEEELLDRALLVRMSEVLFNPNTVTAGKYIDVVNIELLQLATLVIRKKPLALHEMSKGMIQYGWNHLKLDEPPVKVYAFIHVCQFLDVCIQLGQEGAAGAYTAPEKPAIQVFGALLRLSGTDTKRNLPRTALDVLLPAMARIPKSRVDSAGEPAWVRYTNKALAAENFAMPTLLQSWQLIVRHADMFYCGRGYFVNHMMSTILKLGLQQQTVPENRRLALDLAGLIVYWEMYRQAPPPPKEDEKKDTEMVDDGNEDRTTPKTKRARSSTTEGEEEQRAAKLQKRDDTVSSETGGAVSFGAGEGALGNLDTEVNGTPFGAPNVAEYILPPAQQEQLITFLGRMAFLVSEGKDPDTLGLYYPTLDLLDEAARVFKGAILRFHTLEKLMSPPLAGQPESLQPIITGLEVFTRILHRQPGNAVKSGNQLLQLLVDTVFQTQSEKILDLWTGVVRKMLSIWKIPTAQNPTSDMPVEAKNMFDKIQHYCTSHLEQAAQGPTVHQCSIKAHQAAVTTCIRFLQAVGDLAPDWTQQLLRPLYLLLQRMVSDHTNSAANGFPPILMLTRAGQAPGMRTPLRDMDFFNPDYGSIAWIFVEGYRLIKNKHINDNEAMVKLCHQMSQIVSGHSIKLLDPAVPWAFLEGTREWLLANKSVVLKSDRSPHPLRMLQVLGYALRTGMGNPAYVTKYEATYMDLLSRLLTEPPEYPIPPETLAQQRKELFDLTEKVYMFGLRCRVPATRHKFFKIWNEMLPMTLFDRLKFIVAGQEWDHLSNVYWLKHGLDLLLAVLVDDEPIKLAPSSAQVPGLLGATRSNMYTIRTSGGEIRSTLPMTHSAMGPMIHQAGYFAGPVPGAAPPGTGGAALASPTADGQGGPGAAAAVALTPSPTGPVQQGPGVPAQQPASAAPGGGAIPLGENLPKVPYLIPLGPNKHADASTSQAAAGLSAVPARLASQGTAAAAPSGPPTTSPDPAAAAVPAVPHDAATAATVVQSSAEAPQASGQPGPTGAAGAVQDGSHGAGPAAGARQSPTGAPLGAGATDLRGQSSAVPEGTDTPRGTAQATPDHLQGLGHTRPPPVIPLGQLKREATAGLQLPKQIDQLMSEHVEFLYRQGGLYLGDLLDALSNCATSDNWLTHQLWVLLFPIVWATMNDNKDMQVTLAKPIIMLLSKEYHLRAAQMRPNVIQALLEGISLSQPQPKIPSELIKFLGKTFNAWHCAIPLLESHVVLFNTDPRTSEALAELYSLLNEEDVLAGLWKKRWSSGVVAENLLPDTRAVVTLIQHGLFERADEWLINLFRRPLPGEAPHPRVGLAAAMIQKLTLSEHSQHDDPLRGQGPSVRGELMLWIERYIHTARELNHWDVLAEYADTIGNLELQAEVAWRSCEFTRLRQYIMPPTPGVAGGRMPLVEEGYKTEVLRAYTLLQEGQVLEGDNRYNNAVRFAIDSWWQLPEVGYVAKVPLLSYTQQLVELHESTRILIDLSSPPGPRPDLNGHNELKELLETWKLRTPNNWDLFSTWSSIFVWRCSIYNIVLNAFKNMQDVVGPVLHNLGYREKAWSVNKLGKVALRLGCSDTCINILQNMYGYNAMELVEAYYKTRMMAKAYLAKKPDRDAMVQGINTINGQLFEYFKTDMHAEFFRLRACFLEELRDYSEAATTYSVAQRTFPCSCRGWLSWGNFLYNWHCDPKGPRPAILPAGGPNSPHNPPPPRPEQAVADTILCYIYAIRFGSRGARRLVPRILNLLQRDGPEEAAGAKALQTSYAMVPSYVWLPWVTQLLSGLLRPDPGVYRDILMVIAANHPQPLYIYLRCFMLNLRDSVKQNAQARQQAAAAAAAAGEVTSGITPVPGHPGAPVATGGPQGTPVAGGPGGAPPGPAGTPPSVSPAAAEGQGAEAARGAGEKSPETIAFDIGREVMEAARSRHANAISALELFLTEMGSRFNPRPEERLLAVVHALLHRCYKLVVGPASPVPVSLRKELHGVCRACFTATNVARHGRIITDFKDGFLTELSPDSQHFPTTMNELMNRLKAWRSCMQSTVEDTHPPTLRLEEESRTLLEASFKDLEMPGQWYCGEEVLPENIVHIERIGADVEVVRRHCSSYRRLKFYGSDGRVRQFLVQTGQHFPVTGSGDERMLQLMRFFNVLLEKHPQTRRRQLNYYTPVMTLILSSVRIVEDDASWVSLGEAYEINSMRYGKDPDFAIIHFKKRLAEGQAMAGANEAIGLDWRKKAFEEIETKVVSENVFSQFMYKSLPSPQSLWVLKRYMCVQTALSAVVQYCMFVGGRTPYKMLFSKATGRVFQQDFVPNYGQNFELEKQEAVPFRLTRNLFTFFTNFGVDGSFLTVLSLTAQAMLAREDLLKDMLTLYLREDMNAWVSRRAPQTRPVPHCRHNQYPREVLESNIAQCLAHFQKMAPYSKQEHEVHGDAVNQDAANLLKEAQRAENLCRMDPTWHPWL